MGKGQRGLGNSACICSIICQHSGFGSYFFLPLQLCMPLYEMGKPVDGGFEYYMR